MLYTAQYRYPGKDRLDITIKGNDPSGKLFAPTWSMVKRIKSKTISENEYTVQYYNLLIKRFNSNDNALIKFVDTVKEDDVTVVCFCPKKEFCHRYLLINFLKHNFPNLQYGGEREF